MENIEQRLHCLSEEGCRTCGFTINNATMEQQEHFLELLENASYLQVLALTKLCLLSEISDDWQRSQAKKYRAEKDIELHDERVAYFYERTLPEIITKLPLLQNLQQIYLFNVNLTKEQQQSLRDVFAQHSELKVMQATDFKLFR